MADIAATVLQQLRRYGEPCVVTCKGVGAGSSALPAQTISSFIRIGSRTSTVIAGQLTAATSAMMPPLPRSIQGATIRVGTRTYTVITADEKLYRGQPYLTKLVLQ